MIRDNDLDPLRALARDAAPAPATGAHVSDAELSRMRRDDESRDLEHAYAHAASCAACRARLIEAPEAVKALLESGTAAAPTPIRRRAAIAWTSFAAAAVILLAVGIAARHPAALPDYSFNVLAGGAETERALVSSSPKGAIAVRPGGVLDLVARPSARVTGTVEARAFLVHDGAATPWGVVTVAPEGSVRLQGTVFDARGRTSGAWGIALVLGRSVPPDLASLPGEDEAHAKGWVVERVPLLLVEPR